jgi:hypothetical protein
VNVLATKRGKAVLLASACISVHLYTFMKLRIPKRIFMKFDIDKF